MVAVYASSYLATYPSDDKDPGQSQTVYYAGEHAIETRSAFSRLTMDPLSVRIEVFYIRWVILLSASHALCSLASVVRVLAILTTVSMTAYLAWNYADSRHRMTNKRDIKLTAVTMRRITNSGLASSENSRAHRKKLLYGMFAFFMLWLPPALV